MKRAIQYSIIVAVIALFPLFIILSGFQSILTDNDFFYEGFAKYDVTEGFPNVQEFHDSLVGYLMYEKGNAEFPPDILNAKEKSHLIDVRALIQKALLVWRIVTVVIILLIFLLIALQKNDWLMLRYLVAVFSIASILTMLLLAAFSAFVYFDFDDAFTVFHEVLFTNDNWLLNPHHDMLKAMYVDGIFYDFAVKLVLKTLAYSLFMLAVGTAIFKYSKKRKEVNEAGRSKLEDEQGLQRGKKVRS